MKKLYLLKTFLLACLFSIVGGGIAWADGSDDFAESFTKGNTTYDTKKSNAGWKLTNAIVADVNGSLRPIIKGTIGAVGVITSPTLVGGCGTLKFSYALPYKDTKGFSVTVTIKNASHSKSVKIENNSTTKLQEYEASIEDVNIAGDFTIEITNNSPSKKTSGNYDRFAIWNIQWTGYSAGGVILEPAGLSFGDPAPTVEADLYKLAEFTAPTLINPNRLAVTYGSSNEDVATVDAETGKVTLVGVGTTTITAKSKETATHDAGSASYTLNVTDSTPIAGLAGLRAKVTSTTAQQYTVNVTNAVVTYVNGKNAYLQTAEGAVLCFGNDALDLVKGQKFDGQLIVSAKLYNSLVEITSIDTKDATVGEATADELTPQVVTVADIIANPTAYESRYVTIKDVQVTAAFNNRNATVKQGEDSYALRQNGKDELSVNLNDIIDVTGFPSIFGKTLQFSVYEQDHIVTKAEEITLTIDEAGYATFYSDRALAIPAGIEATTVTAANNDGTLTMGWEYQAGDIVPAGTGILLRGEPNSYAAYQYVNLPAAAPEANLLRGSVEAAMTEGGDKYYKLTYATVNDERILGFFWDADDGVAFMNAAGKAYLALPAEMAAKGYRLDGSEVTGIGQIATDVQGEGQVYSISGVRMDGSKRLPAGIYIINGRKVIVK